MIRVMIVEDDTAQIEIINDFLSQVNYITVVDTANTPQDAIYKAKKTKVDIILMDINFGENKSSGIIATREIKSFSESKIIILTSEGKHIWRLCLDAGADDYLDKMEMYRIIDKINNVHENKSIAQITKYEMEKKILLSKLDDDEIKIIKMYGEEIHEEERIKMTYRLKKTYEYHIKKIKDKLNVKTLKEAWEKLFK